MTHDAGPAFRALHRPGNPFVLANAWDTGSARVLAALGAEAIGTTSAGFAFTRGLPDGARITRDEALAHATELVAATPLPVSADLENGYDESPEGVAETVRLAAEVGLAGASIEDSDLFRGGAYPRDLAIERIRAAVSAARSLPRDFVLLARADGVMIGAYDMDEALHRVRAFDAVGADCLYVPMPPDMNGLRAVCAATDKPVNALAAGAFTNVSRGAFAAAGVARISLGAALARVSHAALIDAARCILDDGDFAPLSRAIPGDDVDALLALGAGKSP